MGIVEQVGKGRTQVLLVRTLVGRGMLAILQVADGLVSQEHALLSYEAGAWWLRDLGSRNGTWLDGQRLDPHAPQRLSAGQQVAFGHPGQVWRLVDDQAPGLVVEELGTGRLTAASDGMLMLPSEQAPEVAVYEDRQGGWWVEQDEHTQPAIDRDVVEAGGRSWRLLLPMKIVETVGMSAPDPDLWRLSFGVSADEEHLTLEVHRGARSCTLQSRMPLFVLLALARRRLEDLAEPEPEQGWMYVDELATLLRMDRKTLNVHVFRVRKQFAACAVGCPPDLVERRPTSGQLRLGVANVNVAPLSHG